MRYYMGRRYGLGFLIGTLGIVFIAIAIHVNNIEENDLKDKQHKSYQYESNEKEINTIETGIEMQTYEPDEEMYVKSIQNLDSDNCIAYEKGFYYFRSQKDYSLCKMDDNGVNVEKLTDEIPGSIYIKDDTIYFINLTDNRTLYTIQTDGAKLTKVTDISMQNMIVVNNKIYFLSVYNKDFKVMYTISNKDFENDRYLYCMDMDGTELTPLIKERIGQFTSDGERLFYEKGTDETKVIGPTEYNIYKLCSSAMDGSDEKVLMKTTGLSQIIPYKGFLYYVLKHCLYEANQDGGNEKYLLGDVNQVTISESLIYILNSNNLCVLNLQTDELKTICENKNMNEDFLGYRFFVINGQLLVKHWESEDKGVVWCTIDKQSGTYQIFEDVGTFKKENYVNWTNIENDRNETFEDLLDEDISEYLADGLVYEDYYRESEECGEYSIYLPQFTSNVKGYKKINEALMKVYNIGLDDKEKTFEKYKQTEEKTGETISSDYYTQIGYRYIYISEKYVVVDHYKMGYSDDLMLYKEWVPLIFNKDSGDFLDIDAMFKVESRVYKERIAKILYKYLELSQRYEGLFADFNTMSIMKYLDEANLFFIDTGMVIGFNKYSIFPGAYGSPEFVIPYSSLKDIINFQ